jgi:hypothetical protein
MYLGRSGKHFGVFRYENSGLSSWYCVYFLSVRSPIDLFNQGMVQLTVKDIGQGADQWPLGSTNRGVRVRLLGKVLSVFLDKTIISSSLVSGVPHRKWINFAIGKDLA